jgi:hypothetical protein
MSEPENHTLHLLREIRDDIQGLDRKLDTLDRKVDRRHDDLTFGVDRFSQALSGEIADRIYRDGGIERRLVDIEQRLAALEQDQQETR